MICFWTDWNSFLKIVSTNSFTNRGSVWAFPLRLREIELYVYFSDVRSCVERSLLLSGEFSVTLFTFARKRSSARAPPERGCVRSRVVKRSQFTLVITEYLKCVLKGVLSASQPLCVVKQHSTLTFPCEETLLLCSGWRWWTWSCKQQLCCVGVLLIVNRMCIFNCYFEPVKCEFIQIQPYSFCV